MGTMRKLRNWSCPITAVLEHLRRRETFLRCFICLNSVITVYCYEKTSPGPIKEFRVIDSGVYS